MEKKTLDNDRWKLRKEIYYDKNLARGCLILFKLRGCEDELKNEKLFCRNKKKGDKMVFGLEVKNQEK